MTENSAWEAAAITAAGQLYLAERRTLRVLCEVSDAATDKRGGVLVSAPRHLPSMWALRRLGLAKVRDEWSLDGEGPVVRVLLTDKGRETWRVIEGSAAAMAEIAAAEVVP